MASRIDLEKKKMKRIITELSMSHMSKSLQSIVIILFFTYFFHESIIFGSSEEIMLDKELRKHIPFCSTSLPILQYFMMQVKLTISDTTHVEFEIFGEKFSHPHYMIMHGLNFDISLYKWSAILIFFK